MISSRTASKFSPVGGAGWSEPHGAAIFPHEERHEPSAILRRRLVSQPESSMTESERTRALREHEEQLAELRRYL